MKNLTQIFDEIAGAQYHREGESNILYKTIGQINCFPLIYSTEKSNERLKMLEQRLANVSLDKGKK